MGRHQESRAEWLNLSDKQRIAWVNEGPDDPDLPSRQFLWAAIMGTLELNQSSDD